MKFMRLPPKHLNAYSYLMLQALQQYPTEVAAGSIQALQDLGNRFSVPLMKKGERIVSVGLRQESCPERATKGSSGACTFLPVFKGCGGGNGLLETAIICARGRAWSSCI